jgi:hypothetical protein
MVEAGPWKLPGPAKKIIPSDSVVSSREYCGDEPTGIRPRFENRIPCGGGKDEVEISAGRIDHLRWEMARPARNTGAVHMRKGEYAEAETVLLQAIEAAEGVHPRIRWIREKALRDIVTLYEAWGKPDQAARFEGRLRSSQITANTAAINQEVFTERLP